MLGLEGLCAGKRTTESEKSVKKKLSQYRVHKIFKQHYRSINRLRKTCHTDFQQQKWLQNKRAMVALGRSPEYHWNQIISKSVHRFSRRSCLNFFLFIALGAILFNRAEPFEQFL